MVEGVSGTGVQIEGRKDSPSSSHSGIQCLVLIARFLQSAANREDVLHHLGVSSNEDGDPVEHVLRAAKSLELKAKLKTLRALELKNYSFPAIFELVSGEFGLILKADDNSVLIQRIESSRSAPEKVTFEEYDQLATDKVILVTKRTKIPGVSGNFDISWFLPVIIKYRKLFFEVVAASFFIQLFALITPLFFQVVVDKVLVHQGMTTLDVLMFGLIVISIFDVLLNGLRTYVFSHTTNRVDVMLGAKLYNHLLALPLSYFSNRRVGDTVARVRELETLRNFITGSALTLVIDVFFTLVFFAVLWLYSPKLTLIVLGSVPLYILLSAFITPTLRKRLNEKFKRGAENQAFLVESVTNAETLKSMAVEPQMQRRWEDQLASYVNASFRSMNLGNIASQVASLINKVVTALILWIGAAIVMSGALTVGQLIAFNMIAGRISGPILRLVQLWQDFQQAKISLDRLGDILNVTPEPGYDPNRTTLPSIKGQVLIDRVSFRYRPDQSHILNNISLSVQPGEVIGVVGRSGSGKSTLTKLIQRLHVPETGRILIDGVDISLVQPAWLRRQIGVVAQENRLFNRSIRDNIALVDLGMPLETVMNAAKLAGAHEFICELPEGYDTIVEEQGASLSGGQRQRLAIARALVTNPRILIFDEATSALDYESEQVLQRNMRAICRGRTVFIIAHRLSAVRQANRIIVIESGQIAEQGSHEELLTKKGLYSRLYSYQSGKVAQLS